MEWIKFTDKIPNNLDRVLIALKCGFVTEQYFITEDYNDLKKENKELFDKFAAWVPMPEYKE